MNFKPQAFRGRRILLHDYCGHPFQLQLAEELASRGHEVTHMYCDSNPETPLAANGSRAGSGRFQSRAIALPSPIRKGHFVKRVLLDCVYGRLLARLIRDIRPEIVILSNTPIDALVMATRAARRVDAKLVTWVQDLLGEAMLRILPEKVGLIGLPIGLLYRWRELRALAQADHLVSITEDFGPYFRRAGVPDTRWTTIPNWAPLDRIEPRPKDNDWSRRQGVAGKMVLLYSGSLGFKHNPRLILELAKALAGRSDATVIVNSEGTAAEWLRTNGRNLGLSEQLRVNGYQPFDQISEVLGSADVLLALLEPDAGVFSVPSKVLSNHCAGRAQLLAVPPENLAARIVRSACTGLVCDPRDERAFVCAALSLLGDRKLREVMANNARGYALRTFQIGPIADRFEAIFLAE